MLRIHIISRIVKVTRAQEGTVQDSSDATKRAAEFWNKRHLDPEGEAHDNFLVHPLVQTYISLRGFGEAVGHLEVVIHELQRRTQAGSRILSVGCGLAQKERLLAERLPDCHFIGVDIADDIVEQARALASDGGQANLDLKVGDFNQLDLEPASFDIILGLGAIHHVEALELFWAACRRALAPGGVLLAQEYVGANRLQWTDAQIEEGTRVLSDLVPELHKPHHETIQRIPVEMMLRGDPSEAVRSNEILPTCKASGFEIDGYASGGCGLLQPVLMHQIATYDPRNWRHNRILSELFEEEDRLMQAGVLEDDFAMFVARPK